MLTKEDHFEWECTTCRSRPLIPDCNPSLSTPIIDDVEVLAPEGLRDTSLEEMPEQYDDIPANR